MSEYLPEGKLILTRKNREIISSEQLLREAIEQKTILVDHKSFLYETAYSHSFALTLPSITSYLHFCQPIS